MSLCRFYPTPSDRMAIIWSLMPVEGAVVLEYGPAGTTHFGGGYYSALGLSLHRSLFTTHISEDDVVMGDVTRLERAIVELDCAYHPKVIFVVASAVVAVIGTDIVGVCRYMQQQVSARLISFEEGGFRGDYTFGLRSVYRMLARELPRPVPRRERSYSILGASAGVWRVRSDVWELRSLMREAFGWECQLVMGLECSVEQLEAAGSASLNLVLRSEAREAAEILHERFGTPALYGAPYGYKGTLDWLARISERIGEPVNPALIRRLEEKRRSMQPMGGPMMMGLGGGEKPVASVQGDYDTLLGLRQALCELGVEVGTLLCSHSLRGISEPDPAVCALPVEREREARLRSLEGQWCLGSDEMRRCCAEKNYFTLVSAPFLSRSQVAAHLPFMGEKGMDYLRELKDEFDMFLER